MSAVPFRASIAAVALVIASGCSNASLPPSNHASSSSVLRASPMLPGMRGASGFIVKAAPATTLPRPWNLPHVWPAQSEVLFVADAQNNQILMYDPLTPNPTPKGSITDGIDDPFGLAVDKNGTLYVANLEGGKPDTGSISIYKAGSTSPSLTIRKGLDNPLGIAVDGHGSVFVSNLDNNTIAGYKAGATTPFETISFSPYGQAGGVGTDAGGNLWIADAFANYVYEIPAGKTTPQNAGLSGINGPANIAFGEEDVMYVSNFAGSAVSIFKHGNTTPWGLILKGIETDGPTWSGFTASDYYFQSNQNDDVVGYKKGATSPFSTIRGIPNPTGIASTPLVTK